MTNASHEHDRLVRDILAQAFRGRDASVRRFVQGRHLLGIESERLGLASRLGDHDILPKNELSQMPDSAKEVASWFLPGAVNLLEGRTFGMAAVNSLLPIPHEAEEGKAQDLILAHGRGKNVAVIGHFPFVETLAGEFENLWIIEKAPRAGDLPEDLAAELLPRAEVVAMSGTTLTNGTCARLLSFCRAGSYRILLGPSTPFASCLFDWGFDLVGGTFVHDAARAVADILAGKPYRRIGGTTPLIWKKEH